MSLMTLRQHASIILAALLSALFAAGCASNANDYSTSQTTPSSAATSPAMWRVSDADTTIYLFGTLHFLPRDMKWQTIAYEAAMAEATITITEADIESPQAISAIQDTVRALGLNPPGTNLTEILGKKRARKLITVAEQTGVPLSALEPMRPWLALLSLTQAVLEQHGFAPDAGVEATLTAQAKGEGDTIRHLESAVSQIELLAGLDGQDMEGNFDASLEQLQDFDAVTSRMLEAWRTGDVQTLAAEIIAPLIDASPEAYQQIFVNRNRHWQAKVTDLLTEEGSMLIAVGAGHLVGPDNLISLLEREGVTVTRIQ